MPLLALVHFWGLLRLQPLRANHFLLLFFAMGCPADNP